MMKGKSQITNHKKTFRVFRVFRGRLFLFCSFGFWSLVIRDNSCNSWACFSPPRHASTRHQDTPRFFLCLSVCSLITWAVLPCFINYFSQCPSVLVRGPTSRFFAFFAATLFASKLPIPHHLFYAFDFRATILPVILQRDYSLRGNFYTIIMIDRSKGGQRSRMWQW